MTLHTDSFKIEITELDSHLFVRLSGVLDETVRLDLPLAAGKGVVLELDIKRVNSSGIQKWVVWTRSIEKSVNVKIQNASVSFLQMASIVKDTLPPHWELLSFYVPYVSSDSREEFVLYEKNKHFNSKEIQIPPRITSKIDDSVLEIDIHPEKYFRFLKFRYPEIKIVTASSLGI